MSDTQREMTLVEYLAMLHPSHTARREYDALAVQIERLRGLLMDIPWHVVEAAEVDDSIAKWFRRRDDLLFGGAAEDKP